MKRKIRSSLMVICSCLVCIFQILPVLAAPGYLDSTFGTGGKVRTGIADEDHGNAAAIQADGKIVVVGKSNEYDYFTLARYNPDGSLDPDFGVGGIVVDYLYGYNDFTSVAIQKSDGKIVAAGHNFQVSGCVYHYPVVARYNPDGTPDATFGSNGKAVFLNFESGSACPTDYFVFSMTIQKNGKIVIAGTSRKYEWDANFDFVAARFNIDGTLDTTFDSDGKVTYPIGNDDDVATSVTVHLSSGKIFIGGYAYSELTGNNFVLLRLNPDGLPDTSFSSDGMLATDFSGYDDRVNAVALQSDGKIIAAGIATAEGAIGGTDSRFALARYNTNGSLDTTFNHTGKVTTNFSIQLTDAINAIALQTDGKIVAAGYQTSAAGTGANFALARYNTNGSLDTLFSGDGKLTTDFFGYGDYCKALAIQPDGKIVAVGYASNGNDDDIALARYLP